MVGEIYRTWAMFRNSKISISNPKLASTISRTKSATFATSIIELISLGHSTNVHLLFLPVTTVNGPCRIYFVGEISEVFRFRQFNFVGKSLEYISEIMISAVLTYNLSEAKTIFSITIRKALLKVPTLTWLTFCLV